MKSSRFQLSPELKFSTRVSSSFYYAWLKPSIFILQNEIKWLNDSKYWHYLSHCFGMSIQFLVEMIKALKDCLVISSDIFCHFSWYSASKFVSFFPCKSPFLSFCVYKGLLHNFYVLIFKREFYYILFKAYSGSLQISLCPFNLI